MPSLVPPAIVPGSMAAHAQPRLVVEDGLILRPWSVEDAPAIVAAYEDRDIRRWHVRTMTTDEAAAWVAAWAGRWQAETAASWALVDGADVLLGRMGVQQLNLDEANGHVAYWVVPAARGRGLAARALDALTTWSFHELGLHRLQLGHSTRNLASCRVATTAGYVAEGTLRDAGLHADGWHDMHIHGRCAHPSPAAPAP